MVFDYRRSRETEKERRQNHRLTLSKGAVSAAWRHKKIPETRSPLGPDFIKGEHRMADIMVHSPILRPSGDGSFARRDMKGFEAIKDQLVELGMSDAKHGVLFGQR